MSLAVSLGSLLLCNSWRNAKDLKCREGCQAFAFYVVAAAEKTACPADWFR